MRTAAESALRGISDPALQAPEHLPTRLARACSVALPYDGAGLSVLGSLRVPVGASDEMVARAEQIQTTTGSGPCLDAVNSRRTVVVGETELRARWPVFAVRLFTETPFRSTAGVPLVGTGDNIAALDLFSTSPTMSWDPDPHDLARFTAWLLDHLVRAPLYSVAPSGAPAPSWLAAPLARSRMTVWTAIDMVVGARSVTGADALAMLRAYAFGHDTTIDALSADLADHRVAVSEL